LLVHTLEGGALPNTTSPSVVQMRADPGAAAELAEAWGALLGRVAPITIVLDADAQEPLLSEVLDHVERRLDVAPSLRRSASPKDVVEALESTARAHAPDKTLFIFLDDLGPRLRDDLKLRRLVSSFLGHVSRRLRGRFWVIVTSEAALPEVDDSSSLAELADLFHPDLRLSLTAPMVVEIARSQIASTRGDARPTLQRIFRQHRSDLLRYSLSGEATSEADFVEFYPAQRQQIELIQAAATAIRRSRTRPDERQEGHTPGALSIYAEALSAFEREAPGPGALLPMESICDRLYPSLSPEVQATLTQLQALDDATRPAFALRIARIVAVLEHVQEQTPITADLLRRSLQTRVGGGDPCPLLEGILQWMVDAGYLTRSSAFGYQIATASAKTWALWRCREEVTAQESSELVREMLRDLLTRSPGGLLDVEFPWDALYGDGSVAHDVRLLVPTSAEAIIVNLLHLPLHRRSRAEWQKRSTWTRIKDRLHWVAEGDPAVALEISVDVARARRMLDVHGDPRTLQGERPRLLLHERTRLRTLEMQMRDAVEQSFLAGTFYFRGVPQSARVFGGRFDTALITAMRWVQSDLA
jgi:hypothetical protein